MPMTMKSRTAQRGFTLTEIAIVLGIIGLILGAIWVAASAVYNNLRVSKATTELLQTAQAIRALYATATTTGDAAGTDETQNYCKASVFPSDMVTNPCAAVAPFATDPWGGSVMATSQTVTNAGDAFGIEFSTVPQGACISLLTSNTGAGRDAGLWYANATAAAVGAAAFGAAASTFPITATTAATACAVTGTAGNFVQFKFKLRG
ncbi:MAG TPA: type II secretion system protein [Alphaproteobacteria bacterium]|nr:type II secretion system protein [Alphaproteobacteria bacterium]